MNNGNEKKQLSARAQKEIASIQDIIEDYEWATTQNMRVQTFHRQCMSVYRTGEPDNIPIQTEGGAGNPFDAFMDDVFRTTELGRNGKKKLRAPLVNLFFSAAEQAVAMLCYKRPGLLAHPYQQEDVEAAKSVTDALSVVNAEDDMDTLRQELVRGAIIYGTSYNLIGWDRKTRWNDQGDVSIRVLTPMMVQPDPSCTDYHDWRFFHIIQYVPRSYVQQFTNVNIGGSASRNQDILLVTSYYPRDNVRFPKGRYIRWTMETGALQDKANEEHDLPYKHGLIPIVPLYNTKVSESQWGLSELEQTFSTQVNFNRNLGYISESLKFAVGQPCCNDPSLKAKDLEWNPNKPWTTSGAPNASWSILQNNVADPRYLSILGIFQTLMQNITGIHSVSTGEASGGVTAASAIQSLASLGSQRMDTRKKMMQSCMAEVARFMVSTMGQYYGSSRWMQMTDVDQTGGFVLEPDQLQKKYHFTVDMQETFPTDPGTRVQMLLQLIQLPSQAQEAFVNIAGDAEMRKMWEDMRNTLNASSRAVVNPAGGLPGTPVSA